jgi:osmotically-inducible protein OsmY
MMIRSFGGRRRIWTIGIVFIALISALAVLSARAAIEAEIEKRADATLSKAGYGWLDVSVSGRNVTVRGAVFSEGDRENALKALREIWEIGDLESRLTVAVRTRPYTLTISRSDDTLKMRGSVPNEETRKTIIGLANANLPGGEIITDLKIDPNMAERERWLSGIGFAFSQLKHVSSGRTVLSDTDLSFEGRAAKPGAYEMLTRAFQYEIPEGISLARLDLTRPIAKPFTWKIQMQDGNVILGGHVPSEKAQGWIVYLARQVFPTARIIDRTVIAAGEPEDWWTTARVAFRGLEILRVGSVTLAKNTLKLEGVAKTSASRDAISALKSKLPAGIDFTASVDLSAIEPAVLWGHEANAVRPSKFRF